jgi:hypothetical protein
VRAAFVLVGISAGIVGASCATVSGLADYDVVDCPGGCADVTPDSSLPDVGSVPPADAANDVVPDTGPPACDPSNNSAMSGGNGLAELRLRVADCAVEHLCLRELHGDRAGQLQRSRSVPLRIGRVPERG